jgi:hypothetical protein
MSLVEKFKNHGIPATPGDLDHAWFKVMDLVQSALNKSGNTHNVSDVYSDVCNGLAFFFPGEASVVIARVETFPQKTAMNVWIAAGDSDEIIRQVNGNVANFALSMGITEQMFMGRPGWAKLAKENGWTEFQRAYTRKLRK